MLMILSPTVTHCVSSSYPSSYIPDTKYATQLIDVQATLYVKVSHKFTGAVNLIDVQATLYVKVSHKFTGAVNLIDVHQHGM